MKLKYLLLLAFISLFYNYGRNANASETISIRVSIKYESKKSHLKEPIAINRFGTRLDTSKVLVSRTDLIEGIVYKWNKPLSKFPVAVYEGVESPSIPVPIGERINSIFGSLPAIVHDFSVEIVHVHGVFRTDFPALTLFEVVTVRLSEEGKIGRLVNVVFKIANNKLRLADSRDQKIIELIVGHKDRQCYELQINYRVEDEVLTKCSLN